MLFKTSAQLKEYAQLTGDLNFPGLAPTLRFVETFHLIPLLGKTLYQSLSQAYTANEASLSTVQKDLLEQCRQVVAPYFCFYYAPKADVQLTDSGFRKNQDAAYQYQGTNYREANLREAEMCEEMLLQFLEEKSADYPDWKTSDAFRDYRSLFIKTGEEFNKLFPSSSPYRNYRAMRGKMVDVEEQMVRMAIGDVLFAALKTKDTDAQDFTDKEKELLFKLKKAISYQTVALSIPLLKVRIDGNGLSVLANIVMSSRDEDNKRGGADDGAISQLAEECFAGAKAWLKTAVEYIEGNAEAFSWTKPAVVKPCSVNPELNASFGLC